MKKRICYFLIVMMLLVSSTTLCFGQSIESGEISPKYIGTAIHTELFKRDSGGEFRAEATLNPKTEASYDKVVITIKITRNSTGAVVYNKTFTTPYNKIRDCFFASASYSTTVKGTYSMDTMYKCYKKGILVETITGVTRVVSN